MTFITAHLAQTLKLRRVKRPISISAVGCVDAGICRYAVKIQISPVNKSHPVLTTTASILKSLTTYLPTSVLANVNWKHVDGLALADSDPTSSDPIDLIIGADLYSELILDGVRKGFSGQPIAQNTMFGWILSGPTSTSTMSNQTLSSTLRKFRRSRTRNSQILGN